MAEYYEHYRSNFGVGPVAHAHFIDVCEKIIGRAITIRCDPQYFHVILHAFAMSLEFDMRDSVSGEYFDLLIDGMNNRGKLHDLDKFRDLYPPLIASVRDSQFGEEDFRKRWSLLHIVGCGVLHNMLLERLKSSMMLAVDNGSTLLS